MRLLQAATLALVAASAGARGSTRRGAGQQQAAAPVRKAAVQDVPNPVPLSTAFISASGVFPALTVTADSAPQVPPGSSPRSECGVGALMAWNDVLYMISYLSIPNAGNGTGLYMVDQNLQMTKLKDHQSVYANRMMVPAMNSIVIGPYVIDAFGNIRTIEALLTWRIGGMAAHLTEPDHRVYMLGMDGPLWDVDLNTLEATFLYNLTTVLGIDAAGGEQPHFKAAYSQGGLLYVASNTFEQADGLGIQHGGRLASWTGNANDSWTIIEETAFVEITGRNNMGQTVFAMGWDDASIILKTIDVGDPSDPSFNTQMQTYRLPKASHAFDHLWTTEWPRIREIESERFLLDMHGMFYELPSFTWGGGAWGLRPISQHLRLIPDFASYRGFLVLGGNQVSSIFDNNWVTGQSQSGLWLGKTDDLWSFGKPQGWGGPWLYDAVDANTPSDPYLMTGFDHKVVHLRVDPPYNASGAAATWPQTVTFTIQTDFTGSAGFRGSHFYLQPWNNLTTVTVQGSGTGGYGYYAFPAGYSAHWVRFVTDAPANVTAWLTYT